MGTEKGRMLVSLQLLKKVGNGIIKYAAFGTLDGIWYGCLFLCYALVKKKI